MGTLAVVNINRDGKRLMKISVSCNGMNIAPFVEELKKIDPLKFGNMLEHHLRIPIEDAARVTKFGCGSCMIIMTPNVTFISDMDQYIPEAETAPGEVLEIVSTTFRKAFDDPNPARHPQYECAEYTENIDL
jgi:hypothetical protein